MNTTRQSRIWLNDLVKGIIALIFLGLMLYFRPDMGAMIQQQLGLPFGMATLLDAPQVASGSPTTLSGRTQAGAAVDVFAGDTMLGTATAGPDGTWSLAVTLPAGTYQLRAQAHDGAGAALGSPAVLEWSSQQQAAAPSGAQEPVEGNEAATAGTETGTAADVQAGTDATTASANSAAAPPASIAAVQVSGNTASLSGDGTPGSTVEVVAGAGGENAGGESDTRIFVLGSVVVGPDGAWQLTAKINPGDYQLIVRTLDANGATVDESAGVPLNVAADYVAKGVAIIAPPQVSAPVLAGDKATLSGTAAPGATVELVSSDKVLSQTVADVNGLWVVGVQLKPGSYALHVRTRDAAGEQVNTSRVVSLTVPAGGNPVVATGGTVTAGTVTTGSTADTTPKGAATDSGTAGGSSSSGDQPYVVQPGDTLTSLAQEYLGDQARYPEIVAATYKMSQQDPAFKPIADANMIGVGQQIWIPAP